MSSTTFAAEEFADGAAESRARSQAFAWGVIAMLALTIVQRAVGFGRGVLFCRWLEPRELGEWDMALGFLMLAAPLAVLGLPGSFGRYLEHYRQRGQLRLFLRRTTAFSGATAAAFIAALAWFREPAAEWIFGAVADAPLVVALAASLTAFVAFNFLVSLLIALRMYTRVSWLQLGQGLLFTALAIAAELAWSAGTLGLVLSFGAASLVCSLAAAPWIRAAWRDEGTTGDAEPVGQRAFWGKLVPFAAWVWTTNLLWNLIDVADRYLLVHISGLSADEALAQVGQYHSSRLIPLLLVSVAVMLGQMFTPHLSHDWEAGHRGAVVARLNLALKLVGLALFACATLILLVAPWLFSLAFAEKYAQGLAVLPWTLAYCVWFGLAAVANNYLWCAEKARLESLTLIVGLAVNVALNVLLLPRFGLLGAVWGTSVANALIVLLLLELSRRLGMQVSTGTWLVAVIPAALGGGALLAVVVGLLVCGAMATTHHVFNRDEKRELRRAWRRLAQRAMAGLGSAKLAGAT